MRRLWLIRHGQSTWNAERRLQGRADPPLSALGRWQARRVAEALRRQVEAPLALYSSDQRRALETAAPIAEALSLDVQVDARLREHDMGEVATGKTWEELTAVYPHLLTIDAQGKSILPHLPGAESPEAALERILPCFDEIIARHAGEVGDVVVVAHGGVFRSYLAHLLHLPDGPTLVLRFGNASITALEMNEHGYLHIVVLNDRCHLREPLPFMPPPSR